jgi:hypothetical protein
MTTTDPAPVERADLPSERKRYQPPKIIEPWDADTIYLGTFVAEKLGKNWQSILNDRHEGRDGPRATRISGRIYYYGRDLIAWLDRCREG